MGNFAVYCDGPDFLANSNANVETASLVGGNTTLSGAVVAGGNSLPVGSAANFAVGQIAYVLDGLNAEKVAIAGIAGNTLNLAGSLQAAHGAGVSVMSAGSAGCLADTIIRASREIENYCRQGQDGGDRTLYAVSRTERAYGPGMRVAWDIEYALVVRPWRWPVQSVSAVTVQYGMELAFNLNLANLALTSDGRAVVIPYQIVTPSPTFVNVFGRRGQGFVATWTYVAGPCGTGNLSGLPDDVRQACFWLIADLLAQRQNPYGASETQQGKVHRVFRHRGDTWSSDFRERAYRLLAPYAQNDWLN